MTHMDDSRIQTLEHDLAREKLLSKRLQDERRWKVFCHALGGYNANPALTLQKGRTTVDEAKHDADAAMQVMCGEGEVSPAVKAWRACTIDAQDAVLRRLMLAAAETGNPGYNAAIAVLREVAGG
jgi:hypothetical protein